MPQQSVMLNLSGDKITIELTCCCSGHAHEAFTALAEQVKAGGIQIDLGIPESTTPITRAHGTLQ